MFYITDSLEQVSRTDQKLLQWAPGCDEHDARARKSYAFTIWFEVKSEIQMGFKNVVGGAEYIFRFQEMKNVIFYR
jgi:hypothetical protein